MPPPITLADADCLFVLFAGSSAIFHADPAVVSLMSALGQKPSFYLNPGELLLTARSRRLVLLEILFDRDQLLRGAQICDFPDVDRQSPGLAVVLTIDELLNVLRSQRTIDYQVFCPIRKIECRCEFPAIYTHPADRFSLLGNLV